VGATHSKPHGKELVVRLSVEDRIDLQDLILRYGDAARDPSGNTERLLDLCTEDVVLDGPRGYHVGTEGVIEFAAKERGLPVDDDGPQEYHHTLITNILVDGEGDTATISAHVTQLRLVIGDTPPGRIVGTGKYECVAKKVDGVWKLQTRIVLLDGKTQFKDTPEYAAGKKWMRSGTGWELVEDAERPAAT
jgi:hypothetical protein